MKWNDLQSAWKHQPSARPADPMPLGESLEDQRRKLARRFFIRDAIEASAGILVAAFFSLSLWQHGSAYWPVMIAVVIVLTMTGFFIRERVRAHRARPAATAPLLTKLDADIAELEHQRRLLLNAGWWYVAPLMLAVLIVLGTIVGNNLSRLHAVRAQVFLAAYVVFCGILSWRVTVLNRNAARTKIEPRIAELRHLRDDLLSSH